MLGTASSTNLVVANGATTTSLGITSFAGSGSACLTTNNIGAIGTTTCGGGGPTGVWGQTVTFNSSGNQIATSSLFIASSTNVGIASTSPWSRLSVDTSNLAAGAAEFVVGSSTRTDFTITQNGRVGIGTTSDSALFNVQGTANATAQIFDVSGNTGSSYLHVTAGGNIGIGSSTPWALLSINPNASLGTAPAFVVGSTTATRFIIDNGGKVGIGTSTPVSRLSLTDAVATAQQTIAYDGSDYASILVNSVGDLVISPSGGDATFQGSNLRVCDAIGGCPTPTATSTSGNLFVENAIEIGDGFSLREIDTNDLGLYNTSGSLIVTFDNGI